MPRFSDSEKENIRQKLLDEGEKLFVVYGLKKVTIDDLIKAVNIAKASFYTFYESKEYLYMDIVQGIQQKIFADLEFLLDNNTSLSDKERVKQVFSVMSECMVRFPILAQIDSSTIEIMSRKVSKERMMDYYKSNFDAAQSMDNHGIRFSCDIKIVSLVFQAIYRSWIGLQEVSADEQAAVTEILLSGAIDSIVRKELND